MAVGQGPAALPPEAHQFDFWVGKWEIVGRSRPSPDSEQWTETKCTNEVRKTHDGRVIEENFKTTGFTGQSWSVYNAKRKVWQQTWVDNSGAYLLFEGTVANGEMILNPVGVPKEAPVRRMVFRNITKNSFEWHWQQADGKGGFATIWELNYRRK